MNISLSDELYQLVLERVNAGCYGTASEYVRSLIRRDLAVPVVDVPIRTANEIMRTALAGARRHKPGR